MATFSYSGRDGNGEQVKGILDGLDADDVAAQLLNQGITPVDIQASTLRDNAAATGFNLEALFQEKIQHNDITLFTRQIHSLLKAGIPIMSALTGLQASTENERMSDVIGRLHNSLDSGRDLSMAMREHPKVFSSFYVNMVRVGEDTGRLEEVFIRLHDHLEFEKFMSEQVKSALRYPSFVMIAMAIAIVIINIFVIPTFAKTFEKFDAELPFMTQLLINSSDFMVANWPYLLAGVIGAVIGFKSWLGTINGRYQWDKVKLKFPIAGKIIQKATLARFARSFALASSSGVPIVQTMNLVAATVDNDFIADKVNTMSASVERGESIYRTAVASDIFTAVVLQMISVGEETGSLDELLNEIADMYQREVEYELKNLGAQIEPIMIVFIGILVLMLALGVFLPMWDLGQAAMH